MIANSKVLILSVLIITLFIAPVNLVFSEEEKQTVYVASSDRRIYVIDLKKNEVLLKTDVINEVGRPTSIDIDENRGRLYVASERDRGQINYSPVVVLDTNVLPMKMIDSYDLINKKTAGHSVKVSAVYEIYVRPGGRKLFLGYSHQRYGRGTTVIDSFTGEILSLLNFKIHLKEIDFSPDRTKISLIWDKGRMVYDLVKNKQVSYVKGEEVFKDEIGLNSPWAKETLPLYTTVDYKYLKAISRSNGEVISEINLEKLTGFGTAIKIPLIVEKGTKAIIPMFDMSSGYGYIVILDLEKKEVVSKIQVGPNPTNVVLSSIVPKEKAD